MIKGKKLEGITNTAALQRRIIRCTRKYKNKEREAEYKAKQLLPSEGYSLHLRGDAEQHSTGASQERASKPFQIII